VAMRVTQGGHDVRTEKLESRYPRTMANLKTALLEIPHAWIFYNDDLGHPTSWSQSTSMENWLPCISLFRDGSEYLPRGETALAQRVAVAEMRGQTLISAAIVGLRGLLQVCHRVWLCPTRITLFRDSAMQGARRA